MPGYFPKNSQILFIGQNPGQLNVRASGWDDRSYSEEEDWKQFQIGYARGLLEAPIGKWIKEGMSGKVPWAFTNVIKCRTPNNGLPYLTEIEECRPFLEQQIRIIQPKAIVTLGAIAYDWFGIDYDIKQTRGKRLAVNNNFFRGIMVPWYHPAYNRYTHDKFSLRMMSELELLVQNQRLYKQAIIFNRI